MKKKTLRALIDDVAKLLQKHVRLKAAVAANKNGFIECVSCNKWFHWKDMQGGHWIERGKQATKIMEENIHPQCKGCNQYGMRHRTHVREGYSKFMRDMYGDDFCDQMLIDSKKPIKYFRPDLEDMVKDLRKKNKELESQL
jgi:hypothetical protein